MKRSYQLMQIFDIQKNYSRHKQKIKSIQHIDTKTKISKQSVKNQQANQKYKKAHSKAYSFLSKQENKRLQKANDYLYNNLIKMSSRQATMTLRKSSAQSSRSLRRSTSLTMRESRLKVQNQKIQKKLEKAKSNYEKLRKPSTSNSIRSNSNDKKKDRDASNAQLKRFLQNQFRIKPTVLFPTIKKKSSVVQSQKKIDLSALNLGVGITSSSNIVNSCPNNPTPNISQSKRLVHNNPKQKLIK